MTGCLIIKVFFASFQGLHRYKAASVSYFSERILHSSEDFLVSRDFKDPEGLVVLEVCLFPEELLGFLLALLF